MEDILVPGLIEKTTESLPFKHKINAKKIKELRLNALSLVKVATYHHSHVLSGISHMLDTINKAQKADEMTNSTENPQTTTSTSWDKYLKSKFLMLQLFSRVLSSLINDEKYDIRFDDDLFGQGDDLFEQKDDSGEDDFLSQDQKEDKKPEKKEDKKEEKSVTQKSDDVIQIVEEETIEVEQKKEYKMPTLDSGVCNAVLKSLLEILNESTIPERIHNMAARVLFKLSVLAFDVVFQKLDSSLRNMKTDTIDNSTCYLIQFVHFDTDKIGKLMGLLTDNLPKFKNAAFSAIAEPLRMGIWNWMNIHPQELIDFCKYKKRLSASSLPLFDAFNTYASKKTREAVVWPVMTLLLILDPDTFDKVALAVKKNEKIDAHKKERKFLYNLVHDLSKKDKNDASIICFIDLFKISAYMPKNDFKSLRLYIAEIQNTIQDKLIVAHDSPSSVIKKFGRGDVPLIVDFVVGSFLINSRHISSYVFPILFAQDSLAIYKLVAAKSVLRLAREGASLSWHPTLSQSYSTFPRMLRGLFQHILQQYEKERKEKEEFLRQQKGNKKLDEQYAEDTLRNLLALFYTDPKLLLYPPSDPTNHKTDILYVITGVCQCLEERFAPAVQTQAYKLLLRIFDMKYIQYWCPTDVVTGFIEISSVVLQFFSQNLSNTHDIQKPSIKTILELLKELTSNINKFIAKNISSIDQSHLKIKKRIEGFKVLEKSLLILMCSTELEVWSTAASCFSDACDQVNILDDLESSLNPIQGNYTLYRKLSNLEDLGKNENDQQFAIRKLIREFTQPTDSILSAMIEVYSRWKTLLNKLKEVKEINDDLQNSAKIWKNYTQFLVSIGGVYLHSQGIKPESEFKKERKSMYLTSGLAGSRESNNQSSFDLGGDASGKTKEKGSKTVEELLGKIDDLLLSTNNQFKEDLKSIIGKEAHPALFQYLFKSFHKRINDFFNKDGSLQVTDEATSYIENTISISRTVLESAQNYSEYLTTANFDTLIMLFIKYISYVSPEQKVQLKQNICRLISLVMEKKQYLKFSVENFRYQILNKLQEWTADFELKIKDATAAITEDNLHVTGQINLDLACMRAITFVLRDLPLEDYKSFLKFFRFFVRYLHACTKEELKEVRDLRQSTVVALSNLLESNFNFGLDQFLKYLYVEKKESVRTAFLDVLTNITKKGIELQESNDQDVSKDMYEKFYEVLCKDNLKITRLLLSTVPVSEQDSLCDSIVRIFEINNKAVQLFKFVLEQEVNSTFERSVLFRSNSSFSKMMSAYLNFSAKEYMNNSIGVFVKSICNEPGEFEVDPAKVKEGETLEQNAANLTDLCNSIFVGIQQSADEIPYKVRIILNHLWTTVNEKFPPEDENPHNARHVAIGAVLFLRFLCPAIISPQKYGLIEGNPSSQALRCLTLITKCLQNVANGVTFGKKEKGLDVLNSFVEKHVILAREFFDDIATLPEAGDETSIVFDVSEEERLNDFGCLHRYIYNYLDDMEDKSSDHDVSVELLTKLIDVLTPMGRPPEENKETTSYISKDFKSPKLTEFLKQHEGLDLTEFKSKQYFYVGGISIEKRPVVYLIARQFFEPKSKIKDDKPNDSVLYFILKTLQSVFTKPYELVFDCTHWGGSNIKESYIMSILEYLPKGAKKNLSRIIIYNPSRSAAIKLNKISKIPIISKKVFKKIEFASGLKDLEKFIDTKNLYFPESTSKFDAEEEYTFSPVTYIPSKGVEEKVIVKVSRKYLWAIGEEKIFNQTIKIVDFIPILLMEKILLEDKAVSIFYYHDGDKNPLFSADSAQTLYQVLQTSKQRMIAESKLADTDTMVSIKQSDVPGSMLNMCFLSLESQNPKTRTAAYNLLVALAEQFSFPVTVLENKDMIVPRNTGDLVISLSQQVAFGKPNLTISFLVASLKGYNLYKKQKSLKSNSDEDSLAVPYKYQCLKYMKPWISNLAAVYNDVQDDTEEVGKIRKWFLDLTKATFVDKDIYPALLNEVWGEISKDPPLVRISMECILQESIKQGAGTATGNILNDLVVTLSSKNSADLVVSIILEVILSTLDNEVKPSESSEKAWEKVSIFIRHLLMLSFQNRINVVKNLPILFYIITLTVGRGNSNLRSNVHGLTMNVIHSLATTLKFNSETKVIMQDYMNQLTTSKFRILFMGNEKSPYDPFSQDLLANSGRESTSYLLKEKIENIDMWKVESVIIFLQKVMSTCYRVDSSLKKKWIQDWTQILTSKITIMNHEILPRIIISYGVLTPPSSISSGHSLSFIVNALMDSLQNYSSYKSDLSVSSILCLSQFCSKMSPNNENFKDLLLISIILLAGGDIQLFSASLNLFKSCLNSISNSTSFLESKSFEDYFMKNFRKDKMGTIVSSLESKTQISFSTHFSFAISSFLMRGLTAPQTYKETNEVCLLLIEISQKLNPNVSDLMGYVTALITHNDDEKIESIIGKSLFDESNFEHKLCPLLFTRYLLGVVQSLQSLKKEEEIIDIEEKKERIFKILQESFERIPNIFSSVFSEVFKRVVQFYKFSKSRKIAEHTLKLINTIIEQPNWKKDDPNALKDISFTGINRAESFKSIEAISKDCYSILIDLLSNIEIGSNKKNPKQFQNVSNPGTPIFEVTEDGDKEEKIDI
eukprot:gene9351-1438_t